MFRFIALSLFISATLFSFSPSYAQDDASAEDAPAQEEQSADGDVTSEEMNKRVLEQAKIDNKDPELSPGMQKLNDTMRDLTLDMSKSDRRHFFMIYNNHNLISTVKYVRSKVSEGVDACSAENPDMEEALRNRFKVWTDNVDTAVSDAEAYRDNMIEVQEYAKKSDIRGVMKQADALRAETNENVKTIPVTSQEACEYLLNKMDETQDKMLSLLRATLITLPKAMQNAPAEDE